MQKKYKNIILTGMMGAGKTTVGKELATIMNCNFIDLDETIEKNYGKISDIFKQKGEEYFRQIETLELKKINIQETRIRNLFNEFFEQAKKYSPGLTEEDIEALKKFFIYERKTFKFVSDPEMSESENQTEF